MGDRGTEVVIEHRPSNDEIIGMNETNPKYGNWLAFGVICVYLVVALVVFVRFETKNWYPVTGDEPHYLIMTSGIIHDKTLEQTLPYEQEFRSRTIYPAGLAPRNAITSPSNAAVFKGPHGLFNYHDAGLPILLVPGYIVAGVVGAKLEMILLLGLIPLSASWLSLKIVPKRSIAVLIAATVTLSLPLLSTASQIYPDLLNGAVVLFLLTSFIVGKKDKRSSSYIGIGILAGIEPWLHIKFFAPSVVFVVGFAFLLVRTKRYLKLGALLGTYLVFLALLAYYNWYAFGSLFGPYTGSISVGLKGTVMALVGLLVDRHQGIFAQQPLFVLGAIWIVRSVWRKQLWAWLAALAFFSILLPGAAFTNVYGGYSFAGRFEWGGAALLIAPTVMCLSQIYMKRRRFFIAIVGGSLILQGVFGLEYLSKYFDFYNVVGSQWVTQYPSLWGPLSKFLPALYNPSWAYSFVPNYIGAAFLVLAVAVGIFGLRRFLSALFILGFALLFFVGEFVPEPTPPQVFTSADLSSQVGVLMGSVRIATPSATSGYLTYGPYAPLGVGKYSFALSYMASESTYSTSTWDLVCGNEATGAITRLSTGILLPAVNGHLAVINQSFVITQNLSPCIMQVRTLYGGKGTLEVKSLGLKDLS